MVTNDFFLISKYNLQFVGRAWAKSLGLSPESEDSVALYVDPDASFVKSLGLDIDLSAFGLGVRSKRFAMLIDNGVVEEEKIAENPGQVQNTGPDSFLK